MGNEQSDGNQFNQNKGSSNNKKKSHSNHYHGYQFNNNNNNDYGHYEKKSQESDNYYGYEDDQNGPHQSDNNNGYQFNYNINVDYDEETEHPHMISGDADAEKILFDDDRRHQAIPYHDSRAIIQCIGWIDWQNSGGGRGTGTVFKVDGGYAYAITAAHVPKKQPYGIFRRDTRKGKVIYQAEIVKSHANCDIAIIRFEDKEGFYANILSVGSVYFMDCDTINYGNKPWVGIYGYPGPGAKARAKRGELWGMERQAQGGTIKHNSQNVNLYFRKTKNDRFVYNKFDTEGGQSGSAIYIPMDDGTFAIVGIHTVGNHHENSGEALTASRIKWINL